MWTISEWFEKLWLLVSEAAVCWVCEGGTHEEVGLKTVSHCFSGWPRLTPALAFKCWGYRHPAQGHKHWLLRRLLRFEAFGDWTLSSEELCPGIRAEERPNLGCEEEQN